ncbi:DUF7544 domain-containing protein [Methanofollis tationis]|uniref:DUF4013 domain-containing protein n=1 Tax=Methanofollis tationis TaxID=81417 RepID=A0A7K4HLL0_9EURY|nr:hypothetical protein [Methanofollis tationis]NVO66143.1 hypothetical protein [Methanofollis tationis]
MSSAIHAFTAIDGAVSHTKSLLWPFRAGVWLRLAVISLFIGGFGGGFNFFSFPDGGGHAGSGMPVDLFAPGAGFIFLLIGVILLLALFFGIIGSIFQFVFVDCLTTGEVSLSRTFGMRSGKGLRLFLFQVLFALLMVAAMIVVLLTIFLPVQSVGAPNLLALIILVPAALLILVIIGIVLMLTIDFVVPVMIRSDCGVIDGWRHALAFLRPDLVNAAAYVVFKFLLGIVLGLIALVLALIAAAVIAVPLVAVGVVAGIALGNAAVPVYLLLLLIGIVVAVPVLLLVQVPFATFLRYYSLGVLGRFSPEYDLLARPEGSGAVSD